jgi:hypothetical protein
MTRQDRPATSRVASWFTAAGGDPTGVNCPNARCDGQVVYNGNYFCENLDWTAPEGWIYENPRAYRNLMNYRARRNGIAVHKLQNFNRDLYEKASPMNKPERGCLASADMQLGHCYSHPGFIGHSYRMIKIESIGPKMVRYRGWNADGWSRVERHPRVLFDSWDGMWTETEDPNR